MDKLNTRTEGEGERQEPFAFTVEEAAECARLSRSTIYLALQDGSLPAKKVGRRTLIRPEDLRLFLDGLPFFEGKRASRRA